MNTGRFSALFLVCACLTWSTTMGSQQPAISSYWERNVRAPAELDFFAFLVGKWRGIGKTKAPDGSEGQLEVTWIGRYVLDGMAIADELHGEWPKGTPYVGITLRHFEPAQRSWVIEYLNVTGSFVRRQVNPRSGSVRREGDMVVVTSEDGTVRIRESYRVAGRDRFTYSMETSQDAGKTWGQPPFELSLTRVE